ncbi:unnamed protein product [Leptidea sinapis]|uniref:RAP domain-containing protein n=1 Tax=Leptidea sinapis TaxID=189913 RepID=A0A5E4QCL0_9NEOP|nr:unnamed protein product [Leptidea sinapis]
MLLRSYSKTRNSLLLCSKQCVPVKSYNAVYSRFFSDEILYDNKNIINGTILIENGYNVQELPVVIRKIKDLPELDSSLIKKAPEGSSESINYHLIQEEFKQCMNLRDIFTLINKCTKITPNIALGAIERIYELEKNPLTLPIDTQNDHINYAKDAILEKLLKVVMKTEETQTIINILKTSSTLIEPYKFKFCDELLLRVIDSKLSVEQLCEFAKFLTENSKEPKYHEMIDKLWVGFKEKEDQINETNIVDIFKALSGFKVSKKIITLLVEHKLAELWPQINTDSMQVIMDVIITEKYFSLQTLAILANWFYANIHAFNEETMLEILTKFMKLDYYNEQVERALEKYLRFKREKIQSYVFIVSVLNYCMQFQLRNTIILDICYEYYMNNISTIPPSFLKSMIYPFGFLYYNQLEEFRKVTEEVLIEKFKRISIDDLCSIVLSFIYMGHYSKELISKLFHPEVVTKVNNPNILRKLYLIDTCLSVECDNESGPFLPKDQWLQPVSQDKRVSHIISKIKEHIVGVVGSEDNLSTGVLIPNYCSDETYLIDIMLHPVGLGSSTFNWKMRLRKNENTAILIHLPNHYCSDNHLIGQQMLRRRHLSLLGFKVISIDYSTICQLFMSNRIPELKQYIEQNITLKQSSV